MPAPTGSAPSKLLLFAAFAAIYIIWGSTYIAILFAIESVPPMLMAGCRFLVAGLLLFSWCRWRGAPIPGWPALVKISFSGIMMLVLGTGAVVWVEQYLPSGLTAIIVATVPLWFVIMDRHQWHFHFSSPGIIIGLLLGFGGVLLLFAGPGAIHFSGNRMQLISFFIMIGGTITWAIGSLFSKYRKIEGTPAMKAAIQMIVAGFIFLLAAGISGETRSFSWEQVSQRSLWALLYLVIFGSLVGYMAYVWLLTVRPPSIVGTYAYINPVVAVFLGWFFANEKISGQQLAALIVILAGVLLVSFPGASKKIIPFVKSGRS